MINNSHLPTQCVSNVKNLYYVAESINLNFKLSENSKREQTFKLQNFAYLISEFQTSQFV